MRRKFASVVATFVLFIDLQAPVFADSVMVPADELVNLRVHGASGIIATLNPPLRNRNNEQLLLSIDGQNLRNYTFDQIKQMLSGPRGSSVKIEVGYANGETEIFDVRREFRHHSNEDTARDPIRELDQDSITSLPSSVNLLETTSSNTDLIARDRCIRAAKEFDEQPITATSTLINCMLLSQCIGDFVSADKYLKLFVGSLNSAEITTSPRFPEKAVVQNLVALGRYAEAEAICKYLLLPAPLRVPRLPRPITVLDSYSLIPTDSARTACRDLANKILSGAIPQITSFEEDSIWFGQYLETLGLDAEAVDIYTKEYESLQKYAAEPGFNNSQVRAYCLYSRARLEAEMGKKNLAETDLETINTIYKTMLPKQQVLLDRIPGFFPIPVDVTNAHTSLRKSSPILSPPKFLSFSNRAPFVVEGSSPSFAVQLSRAYDCFSLIKANKKAEAEKSAEILITDYRNGPPLEPYRQPRQNLFCTNLRIARAFEDHGWYSASGKQLALLEAAAKGKSFPVPENDIGYCMIAAERIYNATLAGTKPDWSSLRDLNPSSKPNRTVLSWPARLGILAMAYHYADEPKRAKVFIDEAIRELNKGSVPDQSVAASRNTFDAQTNLNLYAACIYAKNSELAKADVYANKAFARHFVMTDSSLKAVQNLATIYTDAKQTNKAIIIYEKAAANSENNVQQCGDKFQMSLAELYQKNGERAKALKLVESVLAKAKDPAPMKENLLAGRLHEQLKNYCQAAKAYYEVGKWNGGVTDQQREEVLRKSIECAGRCVDYDKTLLAKAYISLSDTIERRNRAEGLLLRQQAVTLMADTDPEKPKQLSIIAYIKGDQARKQSVPEKGNKSSTNTNGARLDDELATRREAAELAANNNSLEASEYWLRLAYAEADAKKIDSAMEDARRGIAAYRSENAKRHMVLQLVSASLPTLIAKNGSPEKAEQLLNEAQARVEIVAGIGSLAAQVQMLHHFDYLVSCEKNYAKADAVLDNLLKTDLDQGRYTPPDGNPHCGVPGAHPVESSMEVIQNLITVCKRAASGKDNQHTLHFLEKILVAEIKQFGQNDHRVAITYVEIAHIHAAADENSAAYDAFESAIQIMRQYQNTRFALSNFHPDYYRVLRKLNKVSELEKIEAQKLLDQKNRRW